MAFQFDLETELDEIFLDQAGTHALDFALGYDLDDDKVIMMSVLLVSGESYLQGEVENLYTFNLEFANVSFRKTNTLLRLTSAHRPSKNISRGNSDVPYLMCCCRPSKNSWQKRTLLT